MLKTSELCIVEIPLRVRLGRISLELVTFLLMLIPSFFTLYLGRFCDIDMRCHSCVSVLFF